MSGGERRAGTPLRAAWPNLRERGPALARRVLQLARAELALLATVCVAGAGLWVFATLAGGVREGETAAFDEAVMLLLRSATDPSDPIGPLWLEGVMRDITALGSQFVLISMTLAVIGYLVLAGKRGAALLVFISVAGGALLGDLLKLLFQRPRPDLVPHGVDVFTASFPSNHAMLSAVTYLTLGALLARLEKRRRLKLYFLSISVIVTILVGISRIYFGVHWPSDVMAGWAVGAAWAMGVWLVALLLQRRGKVEPPTADSP
jgi:undecaprenyl-diphosphatase